MPSENLMKLNSQIGKHQITVQITGRITGKDNWGITRQITGCGRVDVYEKKLHHFKRKKKDANNKKLHLF